MEENTEQIKISELADDEKKLILFYRLNKHKTKTLRLLIAKENDVITDSV